MADVWELTRYVEAHPDNQGQRWRLAKKLYKEGEYRLAEEHLQILSNEWADKSGIPRYLAATYMRLKRFEDAKEVLEKAVKTWPEDAKLWEQLAITQASVGSLDEATQAWAKVSSLDSEHAYAGKAAKSFVRKMHEEHEDNTASQPAYTPSPLLVCPQCGSENQPELLSCWNCKSSLDMVSDIIGEQSDDLLEPLDYIGWAAKAYILLGLIFGGTKTIGAFSGSPVEERLYSFPQTMHDVMSIELLTTHIVLGVALLVAWPFMNQGAQYAAGIHRIHTDESILQSLAFGVTAYGLSWIPGMWMSVWIGLMLVITLAVTAVIFRPNAKRIALVWSIQCAFMAILITTIMVSMHGTEMVRSLPTIESFVEEHPEVSTLELKGETSFVQKFEWESTGSTWADDLVNIAGIRIRVERAALNRNLLVELKSGDSVLIYQRINAEDTILELPHLQLGVEYTLRIDADEPTSISAAIVGVLPAHEI